MNIQRIDEEVAGLKARHNERYGSFRYRDPSKPISSTINSHFRQYYGQNMHGVYIVRQDNTGEVLYIGKSGTIKPNGNFTGQEIPGRLKNMSRNKTYNKWFKDLVEEKGPVLVEYIFLEPAPESPALVEAILLQAFYNEYGRLPVKNNSF